MTAINQKEYLKKYLSGNKGKKKRKKKPIIGDRVTIIDDDVDISTLNSLEAAADLLNTNEDAPQVVGVFDERPMHLRINDYRNELWKPLGGQDHNEQPYSIPEEVDARQKISMSIAVKDEKRPDESPPRKARKKRVTRFDNSPPQQIREFNATPPHPNRSNIDNSPSRRSRRDSDNSPPRKRNFDSSPPRRNKRDYDNSPPRRSNSSPASKSRKDSDSSPPRKRITEDSSPPRKRNIDSSPPRKNKRNYNNSPPRRNKKDFDSSPPRRSNNSPPNRSRRDSDSSPPRKRNFDNSPPRRNNSKRDNDRSPPRRNRRDRDNTPPRKSSPPRRNRSDSDNSPPRKHIKKEIESPPRPSSSKLPEPPQRKLLPGNKKGKYLIPAKRTDTNVQRMTKTLDGKTAGLQNKNELLKENEAFVQRESEAFKNMPADISGANAAPILRDRKTGKIRDLQKEAEERKEKEKVEEENKEKYSRWGRGLKQVEAYEDKLSQDIHEMNKPLARYADDEDLEKYLKEQEREGDPMLAYIRKKKKKKVVESGTPLKPQYEGEFMPNRFGIVPGYRWDGVDRSNGYEKKWFQVQNAKRAEQEEIYKWSTEDM